MKSSAFLVLVSLTFVIATYDHKEKRAAYDLPDALHLLYQPLRRTFVCQRDGYYADQDNNCQIFHVCHTNTRPYGRPKIYQWSFICGPGTIYNQKTLTCTWPKNAVPCDRAHEYFNTSNKNGGPDPIPYTPYPVTKDPFKPDPGKPKPKGNATVSTPKPNPSPAPITTPKSIGIDETYIEDEINYVRSKLQDVQTNIRQLSGSESKSELSRLGRRVKNLLRDVKHVGELVARLDDKEPSKRKFSRDIENLLKSANALQVPS